MTALAASEDPLGRAVILVQDHDRGVGESPLELEDVPHVRASPAVDGLVRVADHRHLVVPPRQLKDELVLRPVGVLVLVHQNMQKALPVGIEDVGVLPEKPNRQDQEVVEVHSVGRYQPPLVLLVNVSDLALENRATPGAIGIGRGAQKFVFGRGNSPVHGPRREFLDVQAEVAYHITGKPHGVSLVINGKGGLVTQQRGPRDAICAHKRSEKSTPTCVPPPVLPAPPPGGAFRPRLCW